MQVARPAAMDLKTDLDCLIECLRYCHDDATRARDVILTIASLCSGSDTAQNFLRTSGGLSYLVNLLSTTKDEEIRVAALYALGCAVERNVFSQSRLCTEAMFQFLYCQLPNDSHSSVQLKRTTTFLIMCLVTNNGKGQTLVRKTKCLDAMLQLFRQYPGIHLPFNPDSRCLNQEDEKLSLELWKDVTGTLCGCVNNPQNDENQLVCACSVPAALYIMSQVQDSHVIQLLCSYFSLLAANNAVNQDRFHLLGGLEVIVTKLTSIIDDIMMEPEKGLISSASNMISMLSSVIADNDNNLKALSTLKVVPLLLKLLALDVISQGVKLKVVITLGCLVSANEGSKKQVVECGGLKLLLGFMMANQDEECAKAAMLVLHACINSDKDTVGEEQRNNEVSEEGCGSSEKEGQLEEHPLRGQYKHLAAKIDILQKALIEERRLRKNLEDERASKEESTASMSQEGEEAGNETGAQELPLESHHNSAATTAADQGIQQKVACDHDVSIQSSQSFIQLQERMNALEQKLKVVTSTTTEMDMKHGSTSSDSSGSELEEDLHCSVSEAENDEMEPSIDGHLRKNFRHCDKANHAKTKENTSEDLCKRHLTAERNQSEGTREFKIPPPVKRRMPLQLVHGNMADKETRTTSSRTNTLSSRDKLHRDRGEVTPPAKVQKVGLTGQVMLRDFIAYGVPRGTSSGKETPRTRRSGGSRVYRTLTYNHADEAQVLKGQPGKWKQENGEGDSDAGSESSDASEVSSIADSVFSSLNLHLSCPIKPVQHNAPLPCRPSPLQSSRKSPQIVIKPARPKVPLPPTPGRMNVDSSKDCGSTQSCRVAKSVEVYDFAEEVADSKKRSSHVFLPLSAISSPISVGSHKRCSSTSASHLKHFDGSKELVDKLNATPKVMLKKHSLKGRNIKMYTFDGKAPTSRSGSSNKLESHPGQDEHRMSHLQKHQGGFGLQEGSRISTSKGSVARRSGSKRKSYSVRYVRGKIQCSQLYRSASHICRSPADYSSLVTCPGCVPPRHCPLLDSHTLLRALRACRHDLCKRHARLMNSLASYISNKMKVFDL